MSNIPGNIKLGLLLILLYSNIYAQYPLAPEVWSIPEEIAIISEYTGELKVLQLALMAINFTFTVYL